MKGTSVVILLGILLWPINLYFANTPSNFTNYIIPAIILLISYFLYIKNDRYYLLPILSIGLFEKKLLIFPVIFILLEIFKKFNKVKLLTLFMSLVILLVNWQPFKGQTILNKDYEMEQTIIRNTYLYPSIPMARIFQNKLRIYLNKFSENTFALIDPNNYFFGFHPRQITVTNQNLYKYPFISIVFILYGVYYINNHKYKDFIAFSLVSGILSLSLLQNFDRNDFLLWIPISLIFIHGVEKLYKDRPRLWKLLLILFLMFSVPQFLRSYVEKIL